MKELANQKYYIQQNYLSKLRDSVSQITRN
jgi:hypothetical protein